MSKPEARTVRLTVPLTEAEARALGQRANHLGMSKARLLREHGLGECRPGVTVHLELPEQVAQALLAALQRMSL